MKRRLQCIVICLLITLSGSAANRYWVGAAASNWNNVSNWSTTSGGSSGASVPGSSDAVFFDLGGPGNCSIDAVVNVASITVLAGYTGTISQNANSITVNGAAAFSAGSFAGGSANMTVIGTFTLSGNAFTSTSALLEFRGDAAFTSGSFAHNNGTVRFRGNSSQTISGISPTFFTLEFVGRANTYTLASSGNITVLNNLATAGTQFYNLATGVIDVKGDINCINTAIGCGGDAMININGTGTQNFNGGTTAGVSALPQLTINKASGTLNLAGFPAVSNNFTYSTGTLSAGTSTFCFTHGNVSSYTISGSVAFANAEFYVNTGLLTATLPAATTITTTGSLTLAGIGGIMLNTGNINVAGDLILANTATAGGGSAGINMVGTGSQSIDGSAVTMDQSRLPVLNINKASGTLSLLGNISFAANVNYTAGTISAGTSTCFVVNNITITGSFQVNNFTISGSANTTLTIAAGSTLTVTGTLDLENGSNYITLNTGTIAVQGDLIDNNTSTIGGGTGTILFSGTGAQAITSTGVIYQGILPAVTINKPSGTLTFPSLITTKDNWTYIAGTLDVTTHNSTVAFANTLTITGSHSLNNIIIDAPGTYTVTIASGTTLTVSGNMNLTGNSSLTINTGTINLQGNLNLANTGVGGGGSGVIAFTGASNQAIISILGINQSNLPAVTINKPSGTLSLPAIVTVRGNWVYTSGTLDATTNNSTVIFNNNISITGSHSLYNVNFEGNFNNTYIVSTGTVLTVTGTLTTSGSSNILISTPVNAATAIQAQGDIIINNTATGSGGTGAILINGTGAQNLTGNASSGQGNLPYVKIQKGSGTLSMNGTISASRDWSYLSGTVNAGTSTIVFGGNNLAISSSGMSFNNLSIVANTSTVSNNLTVNGNLTISGAAVLAGGANTINVGGNWSDWGTGGFTESTGLASLDGSGLQTISSTGGENFNNLSISNSGAGIKLLNNITVAGTLSMAQGNIDLNTNTFTLGLSTASSGTLSRTAGTIINAGSFVRWFKPATVGSGSVSGLFPVGTATDYRPFYVSAPVTGPTTGGTVALSYNDATTNSVVSIPDGAFTIVVRKDLNWSLITGGGLAGGTFEVQVQGTGFGTVAAVTDLRLTQAASVVGTAGTNAGSTSNPQIYRTGLTAANLSNSFYVGTINSINSPLPITLVAFTATPENQGVLLKWETSSEIDNAYFMVQRSTDTSLWKNLQQIAASGNTSGDSYYAADDPNPVNGNNYYRLKQVDRDGKFTYSTVREVTLDRPLTVSIYPNPARSFITIRLDMGNGEKLSVMLMNTAGQIIEVPTANTGSQITLYTAGLAKGAYFVRITHGQKTELKKLILE